MCAYIYLLDFVVTFDKASYTVKKNEDVTVGLLLICPEEYIGSTIFPINVTVDKISVTPTGKSQNVRAVPITNFADTSSTYQVLLLSVSASTSTGTNAWKHFTVCN